MIFMTGFAIGRTIATAGIIVTVVANIIRKSLWNPGDSIRKSERRNELI